MAALIKNRVVANWRRSELFWRRIRRTDFLFCDAGDAKFFILRDDIICFLRRIRREIKFIWRQPNLLFATILNLIYLH